MATQISILGVAFFVFGVIAWIAQSFSLTYVGLMLIGLACLGIAYFGVK